MSQIEEPARKLEVLAEAEVVVAGGGPGGWPAAVAAARAGAKTVLIERYGFLGGMATAGLIGPILGHRAHNAPRAIVAGLVRELCKRLHDNGAAPAWEEALGLWGIPFEPEIMKFVLDEMVQDAGVEVLLHALVTSVLVRDGRIEALVVESKSGRHAVTGQVFVDATGDADVAFRAGAPTHKGRPADGRPMAMGSMFRLGAAPVLSDEQRDDARRRVQEARERGELHCYGAGVQTRSSTTRTDQITPNMTRFAGDPTDVRDLTRGEMALRRDTMRIVSFYRDNLPPGFEGAYLAALPTQIGIRESRQIDGLYTLTGEDIVEARRFEDVVALGSWWIDIHCPLGRVDGATHVCRQDCPADPPCDGVRPLHLGLARGHGGRSGDGHLHGHRRGGGHGCRPVRPIGPGGQRGARGGPATGPPGGWRRAQPLVSVVPLLAERAALGRPLTRGCPAPRAPRTLPFVRMTEAPSPQHWRTSSAPK